MLLEKCDGPPCPRCGCTDAEILGEPAAQAPLVSKAQQHYGVASWFAGGRARCRHCGLKFSFRTLPQPADADTPAEDPPEDPRPILHTVERDTKSAADPLAGLAIIAEPPPIPQGTNPVTYPVEACPSCRSPEVKVTTSRGRVRHHKCQACGAKFKSVEGCRAPPPIHGPMGLDHEDNGSSL